jgi:hypothetical protein
MSKLNIDMDKAMELLASPKAFGLSLMFIVENLIDPSDLYGGGSGEALDPLTIRDTIQSVTGGVDMPEAVLNRIMAGVTLRTTPYFEQLPEVFTGICLALYDGYLGDMITGIMEEMDSDEMIWGLFEATCIYPGLEEPSAAVQKLMQSVLQTPEDNPDGDQGDAFMPRLMALEEQLHELNVPTEIISAVLARGFEQIQHATAIP